LLSAGAGRQRGWFTFFGHIGRFGTFFCGFAAKKPGFPGVPPFAFASQTAPGRFQRPCNPLCPRGFSGFETDSISKSLLKSAELPAIRLIFTSTLFIQQQYR
jgi:hypothetical protein